MKKQIVTALMVAGLVVSCTKSTTKTEQVENPDGSVTTTSTTVTQEGPGVDTARVNEAREDVKAKVDAAGNKIDNAADKAKAEINEAGKDVKAKVDAAGNKIDNAADKAKAEINSAGKDIKAGAKEVGNDVKDAAAKGAGKIEEGAKKLKEDLKR